MAQNSKCPPVPVVCALIEADGRVLLAQRPHHKHLGGKWEFPGGKVELGENPGDALIREIQEELGCTITLGRELPRNCHAYDQTTVEMIPFVTCLVDARAVLRPTEHIALAWARPDELLAYDLAPADIPVVAVYLQTHDPRS